MDQSSILDGNPQPEECGRSDQDSCRHCSMIIVELVWPSPLFDSRREFVLQALHDQCAECQAHDSYPKAACDFCKHLRLGHLFRCVLPSLENEYLGVEDTHYVGLDISNHLAQQPGSDCDLCRLFPDALKYPGRRIAIRMSGHNHTKNHSPKLRSTDEFEILVEDYRDGEEARNIITVQAIEGASFTPYIELPKEVNWDLVKSWDFPPSTISGLPVGFKVIDLDRQCLVETLNPHHYATLSYVWGESIEDHEELQATMKNIELLKEPGVFSRSHLPATIMDSMIVCHELGFRYLWVDRLCIVQDDETNEYNKYDQIDGMDHIYASSSVTIVAASGASARDGISGISRHRTRRHTILSWEDLELWAPFPSLSTILAETPWNSRGWTFQEHICASTPIFFTDHGVFAVPPSRDPSFMHVLSERPELYKDEERIKTTTYGDGVEEYTRRSLKLHTDILHAFKGAAKRLYCGQDLIYGIPVQLFDHAILWQPAQWDREARPSDISGKQTFPSWAWCSFLGPITYRYPGAIGICGISVSLASWAFPGPSGALTPVPFAPFLSRCLNPDSGDARWHVTAMKFAWRGGFFKKKYFTYKRSNQHRGTSDGDWTSTIESEYPDGHESLRHVTERAVRHSGNPDPAFFSSFSTEDRRRVGAKPGRILVFTQRASLELEYLSTIAFKRVFALWLPRGRWMGLIGLTQSIADMYFTSIQAGGRLQMDFLALSITSDYDSIWSIAKELNMNIRKREDGTWEPRTGGKQEKENIDGWVEREGIRSTDSKDYLINNRAGDHRNHGDSWETHEAEVSFKNRGRRLHRAFFLTLSDTLARVNVMLISQQDGIARRLGIGQVYMKRWKEAKREFCTAVLE